MRGSGRRGCRWRWGAGRGSDASGDVLVWAVAWGRKGGYGTYVGEFAAAARMAKHERGMLTEEGLGVVVAHF